MVAAAYKRLPSVPRPATTFLTPPTDAMLRKVVTRGEATESADFESRPRTSISHTRASVAFPPSNSSCASLARRTDVTPDVSGEFSDLLLLTLSQLTQPAFPAYWEARHIR
jgi:hypothetical protein